MTDTMGRPTRGRAASGDLEPYRRFFDNSAVPMSICAGDGSFVAVNRALRELLGFTWSQLESLNSSDLYADSDDWRRILARIEATSGVSQPVRLRRRDGAVLECHLSATARRDSSGEIVAIDGVYDHVVEPSGDGRSADPNVTWYRAGFEQSPEAVYIAAPDGTLIHANQRWLERFGYAAGDLAGLRVTDMYDSTHQRDDWDWIGGESAVIANEVRFRRRDGTIMYGQHVVVAARNAEGNVVAYHGTVRDVADLRLARVLEGQERMFGERLMETSPACVLVYNSDGVVVFANHETERVLGMAREQVIGMTPANEIEWVDAQGNTLARDRRPMAQVLRSGNPIYGVECGASLPLGMRTLLVSAAPLFGANDEVTCVVTTLEDITQRKLVEASLRASLEERAVLLREVYHRVKNNLAAIIGLTEMRRRSSRDSQVDAVLSELAGQVRSMAVAHDLLCQSKSLSRIDMGGYFRTLLGQLPSVYGYGNGARICIEADGVEMDLEHAVPLGMIVNELAINSVKHGFPRGSLRGGDGECTISVSLEREDRAYTLLVRDNGCGLPPGFDWRRAETMGLHLIQMLGGHQLGGSMEMDGTNGTSFRLTFDVNELDRS